VGTLCKAGKKKISLEEKKKKKKKKKKPKAVWEISGILTQGDRGVYYGDGVGAVAGGGGGGVGCVSGRGEFEKTPKGGYYKKGTKAEDNENQSPTHKN